MAVLVVMAVAFAACSRSAGSVGVGVPPVANNTLSMRTDSGNYATIYNFKGIPDGAQPNGDMVYVDGRFYGTTYYGGVYGLGTLFSVTATGSERVLHTFRVFGKKSSALPGALAKLDGVLYGTTVWGGIYDNNGTVYRMTTAGRERILHSFGYGSDARAPEHLLLVNGTFYGDALGGTYDCGTIFTITPTGMEQVFYSFSWTNGCNPTGDLIDIRGTLYGTTLEGGQYYAGTAFSLTTSGTLRVLHNFGATGDGSSPNGGLVMLHGTLYGTTSGGGSYTNGGTLYSLTKSGTETILHNFGGSGDGRAPDSGLIALNGELYATTGAGGAYANGTFYRMTTDGTENILHSFGHSSDGAGPAGTLLLQKGTFYGTTISGGNVCNGAGCGTIYKLTP